MKREIGGESVIGKKTEWCEYCGRKQIRYHSEYFGSDISSIGAGRLCYACFKTDKGIQLSNTEINHVKKVRA